MFKHECVEQSPYVLTGSSTFRSLEIYYFSYYQGLLYFDGAEFSNAQRAKVAPLEQKLEDNQSYSFDESNSTGIKQRNAVILREDAKNKVLQTEKELDAFKSCMVQHAGKAVETLGK